jgi:plasmid stabilization system protein ParE
VSVRFTDRSSQQIHNALVYIGEKSPSGADNVAKRIGEAIDFLANQPRGGRLTTRKTIRRLSLSPYPYVMFYRVIDDDVLVFRFVHAKRRNA